MPPKRKQPSDVQSTATTSRSMLKDPSQTVLRGMKGGFRVSGNDDGDALTAERVSASFSIPFESKEIICQRYPSHSSKPFSPPVLIFTHGAGGGIANPATSLFATGFGQDEESSVVCFQGTMNLPSRVKTFHAVIEHEKAEKAALGGRSMGARAAVISMKEKSVKEGKLVLVSYPLVGQNREVRDKILLEIEEGVQVLFVSGDGDNMCDLKQLAGVRKKMKAKSWLIAVKGADHGMSLKPKEAVEKMRQYSGEAAARWVKDEGREDGKTECVLRWDAHGKKVVDEGWQEPGGGPATAGRSLTKKEAKNETTAKGPKGIPKSDGQDTTQKEVKNETEEKAPPSKRRRKA